MPELLYVMGALLGDGCPYLWRNNQVWLVGEEAFTVKYAQKLSAVLGRHARCCKYGKKNAWFVEVNNAELYFLLRDARRDPTTLQRLERIGNSDAWIGLIEGLFDAEGCVKVIKEEVRRTAKICLDFCNTDLGLIEVFSRSIEKGLGMRMHPSVQSAKPPPPNRTSYHLRIYNKKDVSTFLGIIKTTKLTSNKRRLLDAWLAIKSRRESPIL